MASGMNPKSGLLQPIIETNSSEIHEHLDEVRLETLCGIFSKEKGKRFSPVQLRKVLYDVSKLKFPDDDFEIMFMKMNSKRDGFVTWDEFVSYLILCYEQKDIKAEFDTLENPIPTLPVVIKSNHRYAINRIIYCPTVRPDRTITWYDGSLMTCGRDGTINYWSLDLNFERSVKSTCPNLRVQQTWVTDMIALPDVSVVCTSSTERDLRFYDTSARKFELRVIFTSIECAVCTMNYWFSEDANEESKLVLGDMGGNIHIIYIESVARGPFRSKLGLPLLEVRYDWVIKGQVEGFRVTILHKQHSTPIRQIYYYHRLNSIISCADCQKIGLMMRDVSENKDKYIFNISKGAWCFHIIDGTQILASAGSDCLVRLWNPFVPQNPITILYGHHTAISNIILQDNAKFLYTLSEDKCIKVWDVAKQVCVQNYLGIPQDLGEHCDMTTLYNPASRQWIIGSAMIAVLPLSPQQSGEHTDGFTHTSGVSVVLYNSLFKVIITCGLDSNIVVWNPFDGRRMIAIKEAHTQSIHAEIIPIEITAATFDPGCQRLITGAHDGSLKIWNFNTGTCIRNMKLEQESEVKCIVWVNNRILAMGWNRRVTEFGDSGDIMGTGGEFYKNWDLRHKEDISAATVRVPQTLVTGTYDGEIIMWRLETGQPYKQYNVAEPTTRIKIQYKKMRHTPEHRDFDSVNKRSIIAKALGKNTKPSKAPAKKPAEEPIEEPPKREESPLHRRESRRKSVADDYPDGQRRESRASSIRSKKSLSVEPSESITARRETRTYSRNRKVSSVAIPEECMPLRRLAVHCMMFLCARTMDPKIGTLLISLENGNIQVWSHHINGGFITSFSANHKAGDYVICMATDQNNEFLFTGTCVGYIKTWLIKDYCVPCDEPISMPKYRMMFPFLWHDFFMGRAARCAKSAQAKPMLFNSYKGHLMPVSGLAFIDEAQILVSCSVDFTSRLWTLGGRYLQTVGTFKKWKPLYTDPKLNENFEYTAPPDVVRVASSTTHRVLRGGATLRKLTFKQMQARVEKELTHVDHSKIYGNRVSEPILGHYYKPSIRTTKFHEIKFDTSFPYIPVYRHLDMRNLEDIRMPVISKPKDVDTFDKNPKKKT